MNSVIKYNGRNILYFNFKFKIFPGLNEVESAVLDGILSHPGFIPRFEKGDLVIVEDNRPSKLAKKAKKVELKPEKAVVKMMSEIYSVDFLNSIIEQDGRPAVVKAATKRIEYLSHNAEDKEVKNDGHFE